MPPVVGRHFFCPAPPFPRSRSLARRWIGPRETRPFPLRSRDAFCQKPLEGRLGRGMATAKAFLRRVSVILTDCAIPEGGNLGWTKKGQEWQNGDVPSGGKPACGTAIGELQSQVLQSAGHWTVRHGQRVAGRLWARLRPGFHVAPQSPCRKPAGSFLLVPEGASLRTPGTRSQAT